MNSEVPVDIFWHVSQTNKRPAEDIRVRRKVNISALEQNRLTEQDRTRRQHPSSEDTRDLIFRSSTPKLNFTPLPPIQTPAEQIP